MEKNENRAVYVRLKGTQDFFAPCILWNEVGAGATMMQALSFPQYKYTKKNNTIQLFLLVKDIKNL
jgi:hypothetical protein